MEAFRKIRCYRTAVFRFGKRNRSIAPNFPKGNHLENLVLVNRQDWAGGRGQGAGGRGQGQGAKGRGQGAGGRGRDRQGKGQGRQDPAHPHPVPFESFQTIETCPPSSRTF